MIDSKIINIVLKNLEEKNIKVLAKDTERPWGGFLVIDEKSTKGFLDTYFPEIKIEELGQVKLSPKLLFVAPNKKLSWQYHLRREEVWKLIDGVSGIIRSETDQEGELIEMKKGEVIFLKRNERHRLVGLNHWGVVAEIWKHTDSPNPSDEEDIIRIQDDFGRAE